MKIRNLWLYFSNRSHSFLNSKGIIVMVRFLSKLKCFISQSGIFNQILSVLRSKNNFLNTAGTGLNVQGFTRSFITISSSCIGMATTAWNKSDILYRVTDSNQQKMVDSLLFSLVAINEQNVRISVTEFIKEVRECIYEFVFNCLYYNINIANVCETNLNNFFHFANADHKTDPEIIRLYNKMDSKRLSTMLNSLLDLEAESNTQLETLYPACHKMFKHTFPFNEKYFFKVVAEYLCKEDFTCDHITKSDFNFVLLYLIIHDIIRLSVRVSASYIFMQFHPFRLVYSQLLVILHCYMILKNLRW